MATLDEIRLQQLLAPFNRTGVMSSSQAIPMINNIPMINTGAIDQSLQNTDLVEQIIAENQMKANTADTADTADIAPFFFPTSNIRQQVPLQNLGIDTSYGVANEEDNEQVQYLPGQEPSGIAKLLDYIPFVGEKSLGGAILRGILPEPKPEFTNIRNFYGDRFGLDSIGRVASGIMKGYNPVSGGFLNTITGGKFGQPTNYGLAGAMQKRISNILGRKIAQTDISRARVKKLKELRDREIRDRADFGESLSSIGKSTFTGKGQAFAPKTNTFSGGKTKTTGGVPGGKYGSPK